MSGDHWTREVMYAKIHYSPPKGGAFAPPLPPLNPPLLNLSLTLGKVPVAPVFKKGDRTDPNNYRPISVIPAVGKILEHIVYQQTLQHLLKNNLYTSHQSGFHSPLHY